MVAIIDDREDVWGRCPNLVHVKPYVFFSGTSDINAPPPLVPTSTAPSSSLPSTPTTPRPFFGSTNQSSGVVPHGQPKPFKMRHIVKQVQPVRRQAQPQSDLASRSRCAEDNGRPLDEQQQHQSHVESRLNEHGLADEVDTNSARLVGGTNKNHSIIQDAQFISATNTNKNNNNNKRRSGGEGMESDGSDSDEEGGAEGTGEGGGEEGDQGVGQVGSGGKKEGRKGKGDGGSSSSSSDSSNDSDDSSSSGSSSAMDDSVQQDVKLPSTSGVGVDVGGKVADTNVPAEGVAEKQGNSCSLTLASYTLYNTTYLQSGCVYHHFRPWRNGERDQKNCCNS